MSQYVCWLVFRCISMSQYMYIGWDLYILMCHDMCVFFFFFFRYIGVYLDLLWGVNQQNNSVVILRAHYSRLSNVSLSEDLSGCLNPLSSLDSTTTSLGSHQIKNFPPYWRRYSPTEFDGETAHSAGPKNIKNIHPTKRVFHQLGAKLVGKQAPSAGRQI